MGMPPRGDAYVLNHYTVANTVKGWQDGDTQSTHQDSLIGEKDR